MNKKVTQAEVDKALQAAENKEVSILDVMQKVIRTRNAERWIEQNAPATLSKVQREGLKDILCRYEEYLNTLND